jgi:ubiquinone/menaquinone biosynthesis C-methylase UbiE
MSNNTNQPSPITDPTPIFEAFRWRYGSNLLTAAVAHFGVFEQLAQGPFSEKDLKQHLQLESRPFVVLFTALQAMNMVQRDSEGRFQATEMALEHLDSKKTFYVGDYLGLAADSPEVLDLVERLKTNQPADIDHQGAAFIYRAGVKSAMEQTALARHFTLSLAGRARNVAPALAEKLDLKNVFHLVDVAGGTGIYALALLEKNPHLEVTLVDLPEVLNIAREMAAASPHRDRLHLVEGDMFEWKPDTKVDAFLFSNIFHDWDVAECQNLMRRYSGLLEPAGRLIVHDVFLNDALDGPASIAFYSAALFTLTEGRAYSAGEYRSWMEACGLEVTGPFDTLIHCGILTGTKK